MSNHSVIAPSSAARRVQCRASCQMEQKYPQTESEASREGTAAHELAAAMIGVAAVGANFDDKVIGTLSASNGITWTQEHYDAALIYADDVRTIMRQHGAFNPDVEQRVQAPRVHPELWGTPDCTLFVKATGTLYLWDFKYGHKVVEVRENWQLIEYAIGKLDQLTGYNGLGDPVIKVVMTVVQPRAYHRNGTVRRWEITGADLRGYANILHDVEHEALGPNPVATTGPECLFCSARHACMTLQQAAMSRVASTGIMSPQHLEPQELGLELRILREAASVIKARLTGLEAQAESLIGSGQSVPGWALEAGQGRERWKASDEEVLTMGDMMGIDLRNPPQPCTPKQAVKKGIDSSVIKMYSETPTTSLKLVESSTTIASAIFAKRTKL